MLTACEWVRAQERESARMLAWRSSEFRKGEIGEMRIGQHPNQDVDKHVLVSDPFNQICS